MDDNEAVGCAGMVARLLIVLGLLWILWSAAGITTDLAAPRTSELKRLVYTTGAAVPADWSAYPTPGGIAGWQP